MFLVQGVTLSQNQNQNHNSNKNSSNKNKNISGDQRWTTLEKVNKDIFLSSINVNTYTDIYSKYRDISTHACVLAHTHTHIHKNPHSRFYFLVSHLLYSQNTH